MWTSWNILFIFTAYFIEISKRVIKEVLFILVYVYWGFNNYMILIVKSKCKERESN